MSGSSDRGSSAGKSAGAWFAEAADAVRAAAAAWQEEQQSRQRDALWDEASGPRGERAERKDRGERGERGDRGDRGRRGGPGGHRGHRGGHRGGPGGAPWGAAPWAPWFGAPAGPGAGWAGLLGGLGGPGGQSAAGGPGGWGAVFGGGPGAGAGRGPRVRRGDVRAAVLSVLADEPMNGYQVIQQIGERSGGAWRPSPGSVYPTLAQLEDEGLVVAEESAGKRTFSLTEAGRAYATEHPDELAAPWAAFAPAAGVDDERPGDGWEGFRELRDSAGALAAAVVQVGRAGDAEQRAAVAAELDATRRRVYRVLAGDDPQEAEEDDERGPTEG